MLAFFLSGKSYEFKVALTELAKKALDEPGNIKLTMTLRRLLIDEQNDVAYQILKNLTDNIQSETEVNALIIHLELHQAANEISSMEQITKAIESNPEGCLPLFQYAAISLFNDDYEASPLLFLEYIKEGPRVSE